MPIEEVGLKAIFALVGGLLFAFFVLFGLLWVGYKKTGIRGNLSPYAKCPMRLGADVAKTVALMVNAFLSEQSQPDNPPIDFTRASYCPETGRIFPDSVTRSEQILLSWDFLQRRSPGIFVSWGSLSEEEKGVVRLLHGEIEGFQTEKSSQNLRPESVESDFALTSPGPLYIDRRTKVLLGWKKVPGTHFEVLVVQRPQFQNIEETL